MSSNAILMPTMTICCRACGLRFQIPVTRSNNHKKFCVGCATTRIQSSKNDHEERRSTGSEARPKNIGAILEQIPDFVMHPVKIIDAYIKKCE